LAARQSPSLVKANRGWKQFFLKWPLQNHLLLLTVGRILGRVEIHNQSPFVLSPQQSIRRSGQGFFQGHQTLAVSQGIVLQFGHHRLTGARFVILADCQPQGGINSQLISIDQAIRVYIFFW
jgi:hypothetical protein